MQVSTLNSERSETRAPEAEDGIGFSPKRRALYRGLRHGSLWAGGTILLLVAVVAILAPLITPHDPYIQDLSNRLVPPVWKDGGTWEHPFGTDGLGRDYLSRLFYGARASLVIGFFTVVISGVIGSSLGVIAGFWGGRIDSVINFIITTRLSLPVVLVALVVVAVVGNSFPILILTIGLLLWDRFAVVVRSATQQLTNRDFVVAARAIGSSPQRIIFKEILPNLFGPIMVIATIELAHAILVEAGLSFLGLGVQPPTPSWGLLVAEAKDGLFFRPWLVMIPGAALFFLILSINLVGDGLRDVIEPEGRN